MASKSYTISDNQLEFFNENGYLVVRQADHQLFDPKDIQQWCSEVESWKAEKGKWMIYDEINSEGNRQHMRVEKFVEFHDKLNNLTRGEAFGSMLQQLSGKPMYLFKDKINFKYPNGNGFLAHTDAPAYTHVGDITHLTINIAIDEATKENGYLEVVNGSHKLDIEYNKERRISDEWEAAHEWTSVPLAVGDLIFFGSYLAHRSAPNVSHHPRRALYATYHSSTEGDELRKAYYAHRAVHFPPDSEREANKDYSAGFKTYAIAAPFVPKQTVV